MTEINKSRRFEFAAISMAVVLIGYSAWLFGPSNSHWHTTEIWGSNPITKLLPEVSTGYPLPYWAGMVPNSAAEVPTLLLLPVLAVLSALMWWKCAENAPHPLKFGFMLTAGLMAVATLVSTVIVVELSAAWEPWMDVTRTSGVGCGRHGCSENIAENLQFLRPMVVSFEWLMMMSLFAGTFSLIGNWSNRVLWLGTSVWLSVAFIASFMLTYTASYGGRTTGMLTSAAIAVLWIVVSTRWFSEIRHRTTSKAITPSFDRRSLWFALIVSIILLAWVIAMQLWVNSDLPPYDPF